MERVPDLVILRSVTEGLLAVPGLALGAVFGLVLPDVFVRGWVFVVEWSYSMRVPSCFEIDLQRVVASVSDKNEVYVGASGV